MTVLVYGGSCSGKSEYAESIITENDNPKRVYIATMEIYDEESVVRVKRHREMRATKGFTTIEAQRDLKEKAKMVPEGASVLLECMGNITANELFADNEKSFAEEISALIFDGIRELQKRAELLVIVSNNVFTDGKKYDPITEKYLDVLGALNRKIATVSDEVYEVVSGIPILVKGEEKP